MSLSSPVAAPVEADPRTPQRVRHQPRRRELNVLRVEKIAAHMIRVTLGGDLDGFTSLGFDDHVKLFFPTGAKGADGEPEAESRDYTPRRYDPTAKTLDIEFVLHDAGPATRWAEQAKAGQSLAHRRTARLVHHPADVRLAPADRRRHGFAGDRAAARGTAGRRARGGAGGSRQRRRSGAASERGRLVGHLGASQRRRARRHRRARAGTRDPKLPNGDYYAWVACESLTAKALRAQLIADHGANPKWMRAAGYWRRGAVAVHENHND